MHTFDHPVLIDVHAYDSEWQRLIEKLRQWLQMNVCICFLFVMHQGRAVTVTDMCPVIALQV